MHIIDGKVHDKKEKSEKENVYTWEESLRHKKRRSWNEERDQTQKKVLEKP